MQAQTRIIVVGAVAAATLLSSLLNAQSKPDGERGRVRFGQLPRFVAPSRICEKAPFTMFPGEKEFGKWIAVRNEHSGKQTVHYPDDCGRVYFPFGLVSGSFEVYRDARARHLIGRFAVSEKPADWRWPNWPSQGPRLDEYHVWLPIMNALRVPGQNISPDASRLDAKFVVGDRAHGLLVLAATQEEVVLALTRAPGVRFGTRGALTLRDTFWERADTIDATAVEDVRSIRKLIDAVFGGG